MEEFFADLRDNPMLLGIAAVILLVVVYFIHKQVSGQKPVPSANALDQGLNPPVPITYNETFNSYPVATTVTPTPQPTPTPTPEPTPTPTPTPTPKPNPPPKPPPTPTPQPKPSPKYVSVTVWPHPGSSLWSIAQMHGTTLARIEALNPLSSLRSHNFNLIYPGEQIRIA